MDQIANFVAYSPLVHPTINGPTSSPARHGIAQHSASKKNATPRLLSRRLNPYFVEWLMGWPLGWTLAIVRHGYGAEETALWRCKLRARLSSYFGGQEF